MANMSITPSPDSSERPSGVAPVTGRRKRQLKLSHCLLIIAIAALSVDVYLRYMTFLKTKESSARLNAAQQIARNRLQLLWDRDQAALARQRAAIKEHEELLKGIEEQRRKQAAPESPYSEQAKIIPLAGQASPRKNL
jgi:hypothetical protein